MPTSTPKHPLLGWLSELKALDLAAVSQKPVKFAGFGTTVDIDARWVDKGAALMAAFGETEAQAKVLVDWIERGLVAPEVVEASLQAHGLEYTDYGTDDEDDTFPGQESLYLLWSRVVGRAMVLTHNAFDFGRNEDKKSFLWMALSSFHGNTQGSLQGRGWNHDSWLENLCQQAPWAHETVAQWCVVQSKVPLSWDWVFDDVLMDKPSTGFVRDVLNAMDPSAETYQDNEAQREHQAALNAFVEGAPGLFQFLNNAREAYKGLWGDGPSRFMEQMMFREERASVVHGMLMQHKSPKVTVPTDVDGQIFLDSPTAC